MTAPEFSFPVTELDAGGKHFQLPIRVGWLRGVLEGTDIGTSDHDGQLDLRLSKSGPDVVVRGTLAADLIVPCSRCLNPATVAVREEVSTLAVPSSGAAASAAARGPRQGSKGASKANGKPADADDLGEAEPGEADIIPFEGDNLVLDDLVRDELLLGIPMIPLCSESCPGIRPERQEEAPADEGIDPRLRPLLRLKNKT